MPIGAAINSTPLGSPANLVGSPAPRPYSVDASTAKLRHERLSAYYESLGRFVDMFARVETTITIALWTYANTMPDIARVIFAGAKIEVSCAYMRQLAQARGYPQAILDDLENVLQQLGIINGVRNAILHYGATSVETGNAVVSNAFKAKGEPTIFPISPTLLDEMYWDLRKIMTHLKQNHLGPPPLPVNKRVSDVLGAAWQYKYSSQPSSKAKKGKSQPQGKRDPKRPRPPKPSRE
jgi:hypothetical protein